MSRFDDEDERYSREFRARMNVTLVFTSILSFFISFAIIMAMTNTQTNSQSCTVQPCESSQNGQ